MKRILCILCVLLLTINLAPGVHAVEISDSTLEIMQAVGGDSLEQFTANWNQINSQYPNMEKGLHAQAYRDYYYKQDRNADKKYVEFLANAGMCDPGDILTNDYAYFLLRDFRNKTAHILDDPEAYYQALARYQNPNQMAASLFDVGGSSLQPGSLLLGSVVGIVAGMGLMALISKKKNAKA